MAGQESVERHGGRDDGDDVADAQTTARRDEATEDVDAILDEIDGVLEENAEEFVKQFVQKGGQ